MESRGCRGRPYLVGEALDQDGDEEVEEDVVAEGHQGHEVEGSPVARALHPQEEDNVPVLLGKDLEQGNVPTLVN